MPPPMMIMCATWRRRSSSETAQWALRLLLPPPQQYLVPPPRGSRVRDSTVSGSRARLRLPATCSGCRGGETTARYAWRLTPLLAVVVSPVHPLKNPETPRKNPAISICVYWSTGCRARCDDSRCVVCNSTVDEYTVSMHASVFYESTGAGVGGGGVSVCSDHTAPSVTHATAPGLPLSNI
jgi:hypothetical protein